MRSRARRRATNADILHDPQGHGLSREVDEFLRGADISDRDVRELELGNCSATFERRGHGKIR